MLIIEHAPLPFASYNDALLEIAVPEDFVFGRADIETDAGVVKIDSLTAGILNLELWAGEVAIGNLTVTGSAEIEGGAGELNINGGVGSLDVKTEE